MMLYFSSKGLRIWYLFKEKSLLLELLRDDIYSKTEMSGVVSVDIPKLSDRLVDILSMLTEMLEAEKSLIKLAI